MNRKLIAATALITLTGILAGCAPSLPVANNTTTYRPPVETVRPQETQAASDMERIILSDGDSDIITDTAVTSPAKPTSEAKEAPTETAKPKEAKKPVSTPQPTEKPKAKPSETQKKPPKQKAVPTADASLDVKPPIQPEKTEPTPQPEKPKPTKEPVSTPEPTPEPTPAPTSEPQPEIEAMGGGFNSEVLAAVNEARALQGNPALSLDSGLCAKALEHAKEMARQGKAFHSCGGVESVSDSSGGGRTIGARSAIHASDLELNAGLTSLGVGSVKYNGKQYTCVIGR